ncbi:MAG: glycosyltransferase [Prevotellaceae bacterium]|nr:glycosyltransferase [Prevotellaceae bacterium]
MESIRLDTTEGMLLALTGLLFLFQLLYYLCLYNRICRRARAVSLENVHFTSELPPVSVIICAHNACEQLQSNLPAVLEQDYPQFEVIVISDSNDDDTGNYLTLAEERYHHLYHSFVPDSSRYISRKKLAVTLGIKASKYEWIVLTEADCRPASGQWLRLLARNFTSRAQIVLGYSGYGQGKGWLHKCCSFDNLLGAMRYLGFALAGSPYMGIGRNLAYRKELFYAQKGFSANLNLQRGDDDLFVNRTASAGNTRVETDADATVRRLPLERVKDWREEKIGYASTARLYRGAQRYLAGWETCTRLLFYAGWIATAVTGLMHRDWWVAAAAVLLFIARFCMQATIFHRTAKALGDERNHCLALPLFDLLQPCQSLCWKLYCLFRKRSDFLRK